MEVFAVRKEREKDADIQDRPKDRDKAGTVVSGLTQGQTGHLVDTGPGRTRATVC